MDIDTSFVSVAVTLLEMVHILMLSPQRGSYPKHLLLQER